MATYAVGDVQGCWRSLRRLIEVIDFDPARDRLWLVGDLVNRGPDSLSVLRWARGLGEAATVVLGNHDLHLLARAAGVVAAKRRDTLDAVLAAPDRDPLIDWLRTRPLCHVEGDHLLVHAGLHPRWSASDARARAAEIEAALAGPGWREALAASRGAAPPWHDRLRGVARMRAILSFLIRVRTCTGDAVLVDHTGPPEQAPAGAVPWYRLPDPAWRDHTVVFGHWATHGLRLGDRWIATDAGCVWGGRLCAVRLDDRAVFAVACADRVAGRGRRDD